MPRFSANLGFLFTEEPFLERFRAAAQAGFTAVEFPDPYSFARDDLTARLREHDLACVLFNMPLGDRANGERGIACLPDRVREFRDGVTLAVEAARALGCPRINCMAGRQPEGADPAELRATLVDNVRFAARALAAAGLTLCVEPLSTPECPGFFLTGSQQVLDLMHEVGEANVKLQYDCYHMHVMEGGVEAALARLLPLIGHIQFADAPGRHEPGTGQLRYDEIFALLDRLGYTGWVGAEYRPTRRTAETLGWKR